MSIESAKRFIESHLSKHNEALANALSADYRTPMDARVSILDISFDTISVNAKKEGGDIPTRNLRSAHAKLISLLKADLLNRTFNTLEDPKAQQLLRKEGQERVSLAKCILILNGNKPFLVGNSFDSIRSIITKMANTDALKKTVFGVSEQTWVDEKGIQVTGFRSKLDIGHIPSANNENLTSPLEEKLLTILENTNSSALRAQIATRLQELYDIQLKFTYDFRNTSAENIDLARNKLGSGYVVLTVHSRRVNNVFSVEESAIYNKVLMDIAADLNPVNIPGSNSILQDSIQAISDALVNILGTSKVNNVKPHSKVSSSVDIKSSPKVAIDSSYKPSQLRNIKGQFTSLVSLQNLLNQNLAVQIQKNMGNGSRSNVLNYRTGRFAESVQVERMSQSREGMITAFYTYMKNPYQTFEPGFAQGTPLVRDPKLLISKSIREIGANMVANRMRAVLV